MEIGEICLLMDELPTTEKVLKTLGYEYSGQLMNQSISYYDTLFHFYENPEDLGTDNNCSDTIVVSHVLKLYCFWRKGG